MASSFDNEIMPISLTATTPEQRDPESISDSENSESPSNAWPIPRQGEEEKHTKFFEKVFFKRIKVYELLKFASNARGGSHQCQFGERAMGTYNVVLFVTFDDGVEWAIKLPKLKTSKKKDHEYLKSEYATMVYLHSLGTVPVPKIYGANFDWNNPAKTPYFFMEKVSGVPFSKAIMEGMGREGIHQILFQLAQFKKLLFSHPYGECGSHTSNVDDWGETSYTVGRQYNAWTIIHDSDPMMKRRCNFGPYQTSLHYYSNLLHNGWSDWMQDEYNTDDPGRLTDRYKIHAFLASTLFTYVNHNLNHFFLAHPDLHESNIFIDEEGNITGIIDWEHSSMLPKQASEHYPVFLIDESEFADWTEAVYDDPLIELQHWRDFYAKQFDDDPELGDYFINIKSIIAFETVLRAAEEATIDNLVNKFKLVESAEALDHIGLPFPWKSTIAPPAGKRESRGKSA
jgi:serine/threonine protein kinase